MTRTDKKYIHGLKWETRFVISYIVVTCMAVLGMIYADATVAAIILTTLIVLGISLAGVLRSLLRDDYLHTSSFATVLSLIPPFAFVTVYVGVLTSWMQRVGFGPLMRIAVTSLMLWTVIAAGFRISTAESAVVLSTSVLSAVVRQVAGPSFYLLPWTLLVIGYVIVHMVMS
jgi:hypothetical protein